MKPNPGTIKPKSGIRQVADGLVFGSILILGILFSLYLIKRTIL